MEKKAKKSNLSTKIKNNSENNNITMELKKNNENENISITDLNEENENENETKIFNNISFYSESISEAAKRGKEYIKNCTEGVFMYNNIITDVEKPKISVIIPVFNAEKTIKNTVRSAQNQNLKDIEIILVNDYSQDKSLEIIEEMINEDKRIKVINNKKNMGILYSRCVGTLMAKGEYIFPLDNDDMFLVGDIFEFVYNEAKKDNFDIISFMAISTNSYNLDNYKDNFFDKKRKNIILRQPQLGIYPISLNNNYRLYDPHIWGKGIKSQLYKKAINALGEERYSVYNCWNEDITMVFIIFNFAQNCKVIRKYGILNFRSKNTASYSQSTFNLMNTEINLIDVILEFSSVVNKKYAAFKALNLRNSWLFQVKDERIKMHLTHVLRKIIECKYIDNRYKNNVKHNYQGIGF